jgi:hypothetical protein
MIRTLKLSSVTCIIVALCGCVTPQPHLEFFNGSVTTGGDTSDFQEIPMTSIPQKRNMYVVSHARWDPAIRSAGKRTVIWRWYSSDGKLVAERKDRIWFDRTPRQFWCGMPASNFAVGHYRVDVSIEGNIVDTHEFDITQ